MEFSNRSMVQLLKDQIPNYRISKASGDALGEELEEYAEEVTKEAIEIASDNGRKTVRRSDIREALKRRTTVETQVVRTH